MPSPCRRWAEVAFTFVVGDDDCMLSVAREIGGVFRSTWDDEDDPNLDDKPKLQEDRACIGM
jgi:hypothetical protein